MELTKPLILFAVLRALAIAIAVAIAFRLDLPNAQWMACGAVAAIKPDLGQNTLRAEQRFVAALIGASVAALLLVTVSNVHALEW